jgi:helicase-like protein/SNF2 domain-containing protein
LRERTVSARQAALVVLNAWFGREPASVSGLLPLTAFQRAALARIERTLERRGGALLADAVGLGKTYVALSVVADALANDRTVAILIPAALRGHWQQHLRKLPARWRNAPRLVTHTALSFGRIPSLAAQLIVVDEAHAFRNPHTRRYESLVRLTAAARVLLLSATPINNTLIDLYSLIHLFADDHAFRDLGVIDLKEAFRRAPLDPRAQRDVQNVVEAVVVRRSRADIVAYPDGGAGDTATDLRFPERAPPRAVSYDLIASYGPAWPTAYSALEQLSFSWVTTCADPGVERLMRLQLLKRLESSVVAFTGSLRRHARLCALLLDALRAGRWIAPATLRSLVSGQETDLQLPLESILTDTLPRECDANALRAALQADRELLRECLRMLRQPSSQPDPKLAALRTALDAQTCRALVFTQYRDTAIYLWKQLSRHVRTGLVHGAEARLGKERAARSTVIGYFAPAANGIRPPPDRLRLDVLITTDVLAEGLNLQDANVVVNYDIPWNPVTLMQRIGRLDRLGSPHAAVQTFYFVPDRGLDELLGLMDRVERKLQLIERTVGSDGAVLDGRSTHSPRAFVAALQGQAAPRALADGAVVESLRARWLRERNVQNVDARPVTAALPANEHAWVLVVHDGTRLRLLVATDKEVREDAQYGCRTLLMALDDVTDSRPDTSPPWQKAMDWVAGQQAARALHCVNSRTSVEHVATRRLLEIMETIPPTRVLHRCERLLEQLARPLEPAARARLQSALENTATDGATPLIDALTEALGPPAYNSRVRSNIRRIAAIQVTSGLDSRAVDPAGEGR